MMGYFGSNMGQGIEFKKLVFLMKIYTNNRFLMYNFYQSSN